MLLGQSTQFNLAKCGWEKKAYIVWEILETFYKLAHALFCRRMQSPDKVISHGRRNEKNKQLRFAPDVPVCRPTFWTTWTYALVT